MSSVACPLCLSEVGPAPAFTCEGCKSKYHKDCAAEAGSCVVLGCNQNRSQSQSKPQREDITVKSTLPEKKRSPINKEVSFIKRYQSQLTLIAALVSGGVLGYISGDTYGYERGFGVGREEGHAAGYTEGYSVGEAAGKTSGYNAGLTDGCEWVFEQVGYYAYVTAYNPFNPYNRYPGSNYIAKSNCK